MLFRSERRVGGMAAGQRQPAIEGDPAVAALRLVQAEIVAGARIVGVGLRRLLEQLARLLRHGVHHLRGFFQLVDEAMHGDCVQAALDEAVTEQIIQLRSALQTANRTLERRVEERTAELQKALERVSELNQLKTNFISNISHELRTPLTHIKGYLELLATESLGSITEDQRRAQSSRPTGGDDHARRDHMRPLS